MVQWLGLCTLTAEGWGSIPGQNLQATWNGQKKNKNKNYTLITIITKVRVLIMYPAQL